MSEQVQRDEINEFGLTETKMQKLGSDVLHIGFDRMDEEDAGLLEANPALRSRVEDIAEAQERHEAETGEMQQEIDHARDHEML